MAKLINIGFGNVVNSQKIVAVVNPDAAPVKRMVQSVKGSNSLVDATQGRKTKSVIVTSDHILILSAIQPDTIARSFGSCFRIFRSRKRHHYEKPDGEVRQLRIVCICHHQKPQTRGRRRKRILFPHKRRI